VHHYKRRRSQRGDGVCLSSGKPNRKLLLAAKLWELWGVRFAGNQLCGVGAVVQVFGVMQDVEVCKGLA
jgi:hypothetical protein